MNIQTSVGFIGVLLLHCASAQTPEIAGGGVVNAASWGSPVSPGSIVSIFGSNLAAAKQSAGVPLPYTLDGTKVSINGIPSPLAFVSPTQINALVPSSLSVTPGNIGAVLVVVTNSAGLSASALVGLAPGSPGIFTSDGSGCGPAAALNTTPDGAVSMNSPSNSAAPGDSVTIFGTGFGNANQSPSDGTAPTNPVPLAILPGLLLDGHAVSNLQYAGLVPGTVGVDQINFQVPASTRNGCAVPLSASQTLGSPSVTISIQSGRGLCTDPPLRSWGQIALLRPFSRDRAAQ